MANTSPIFSAAPDVQSVSTIGNPTAGLIVGPTANTAQDGTSSATSMTVAFQAGANGSFLQKMVLTAVGSPAATVARIFFCTVTGTLTMGTTNTASNTSLIKEVALPAVALSQTAQSPSIEIQLGIAIPPSTMLLVSFGTSTGSAGTGYSVVTYAGDY